MAEVEILARELAVKIEDPAMPGTFIDIEGIQSISHNPTKTDADTGHFRAAGRARHIVAERGDEFTLECVYLVDKVTGTIPPGHQALRDLATKIGSDSLGKFQILDPSGRGIEFMASANVGQPAGGRNDVATFSVTLTVSGDITEVTGS